MHTITQVRLCAKLRSAPVATRKMTKTFEFSYILSGVDPHSDTFADKFFEAGCDDATLMLLSGAVVATFARESETYSDAVISSYVDLLCAGATVERFDPDFLVTKSDIAERSGLTRQAISNYAKGERGVDFPTPAFRVMTSSPLWDWVEVSDWLFKNDQIGKEIFHEAQISRGVNMFIEQNAAITSTEKAFHQKINSGLLAA